MTLWYKIAIACGVLPLLVGTITFGAWLATDLDELELFGITVIVGGLILFVIGLVALDRFATNGKRIEVTYKKPAAIAAAILLLNFPVALAYMAVAASMENSFFVTIESDFPEPIRDLVLTDPRGTGFRLEEIEPGSARSACYDFSGEGEVLYSMALGDDTQNGVLIGYITSNMGHRTELHLTEYGRIEISESYHRISLGELLQFCTF